MEPIQSQRKNNNKSRQSGMDLPRDSVWKKTMQKDGQLRKSKQKFYKVEDPFDLCELSSSEQSMDEMQIYTQKMERLFANTNEDY